MVYMAATRNNVKIGRGVGEGMQGPGSYELRKADEISLAKNASGSGFPSRAPIVERSCEKKVKLLSDRVELRRRGAACGIIAFV